METIAGRSKILSGYSLNRISNINKVTSFEKKDISTLDLCICTGIRLGDFIHKVS